MFLAFIFFGELYPKDEANFNEITAFQLPLLSLLPSLHARFNYPKEVISGFVVDNRVSAHCRSSWHYAEFVPRLAE